MRSDSLKREISAALLVKLALLFLIWLVFFSHPLDRALNANDMDRVLLGGPAATTPAATAHASLHERSKESRHEP